MNGTLKVLGSALITAVAMMAIIAQAASGHEFKSEASPTELTGATSNTLLKIGNFEITCADTTFSGTLIGKEVDDITLHPTFNNTENTCTSNLGKASVHTEGCDYTFDSDTDANGHAQLQIVCEAGKEITIINNVGCTLHMPPQVPTGGVSYHNDGAGTTRDIILTTTMTGFTLIPTHAFACTLSGLSGHLTGGTTTGDLTFQGYEDPSAHCTRHHKGIWVE